MKKVAKFVGTVLFIAGVLLFSYALAMSLIFLQFILLLAFYAR